MSQVKDDRPEVEAAGDKRRGWGRRPRLHRYTVPIIGLDPALDGLKIAGAGYKACANAVVFNEADDAYIAKLESEVGVTINQRPLMPASGL